MLIYDKFGYNRIQARLIHEIIKDENKLYNEIEHELHHNNKSLKCFIISLSLSSFHSQL